MATAACCFYIEPDVDHVDRLDKEVAHLQHLRELLIIYSLPPRTLLALIFSIIIEKI